MYAKRLKNKDILNFRFAPPFIEDTESSADAAPTPPFPEAESWQNSVYYLWWLYLRENEDYRSLFESDDECLLSELLGSNPNSEQHKEIIDCVARDFGDVRNQNFIDWWISKGRELFCEPKGASVAFVESSSIGSRDINYRFFKNKLLLAIPLENTDLTRVLSEVRKLWETARLDFEADEKSTRKISNAVYPVYARPNLPALYKRLQVLRAQNKNPEKTFLEIDRELMISPPGSDVASINSLMSRLLKEAKTAVHFSACGFFPVLKGAPKIEKSLGELHVQRESNASLRRREMALYYQQHAQIKGYRRRASG